MFYFNPDFRNAIPGSANAQKDKPPVAPANIILIAPQAILVALTGSASMALMMVMMPPTNNSQKPT